MKPIFASVLAVTLLVPLLTHASDIVVSHSKVSHASVPYVGVSLGSVDYDQANDSSPSLSIFGGLALNELLAVELGMADFGDVNNAASEASAFYGSVVANYSLSNELNAFVQLGLASWDYDVNGASDSSVDVFLGGGLDYAIGGDLAARFAIQQFSLDASFSGVNIDENLMNVSVGLLYHF